jgi:hypothetical protein
MLMFKQETQGLRRACPRQRQIYVSELLNSANMRLQAFSAWSWL